MCRCRNSTDCSTAAASNCREPPVTDLRLCARHGTRVVSRPMTRDANVSPLWRVINLSRVLVTILMHCRKSFVVLDGVVGKVGIVLEIVRCWGAFWPKRGKVRGYYPDTMHYTCRARWAVYRASWSWLWRRDRPTRSECRTNHFTSSNNVGWSGIDQYKQFYYETPSRRLYESSCRTAGYHVHAKQILVIRAVDSATVVIAVLLSSDEPGEFSQWQHHNHWH